MAGIKVVLNLVFLEKRRGIQPVVLISKQLLTYLVITVQKFITSPSEFPLPAAYACCDRISLPPKSSSIHNEIPNLFFSVFYIKIKPILKAADTEACLVKRGQKRLG